MNLKIKKRILIENITIFATLTISVLMLLLSFVNVTAINTVMSSTMDMGNTVQRVFSIVLIITTINLYKRKRVAWLITVAVLVMNIVGHILMHTFYPAMIIFLLAEALLTAIFLITAADFCCPSDQKAVKTGVGFLIGAIIGIIISICTSYHMINKIAMLSKKNIVADSIKFAFMRIFGNGTGTVIDNYNGIAFDNIVFWFTWICIILSVIFLVKPFLNQRNTTKADFEHARRLVNQYGQNPGSYLTLEDDKTLYFGKKADGVIAYGVVGDTIVVNGDPICADADFPTLLQEFTEMATKSAHNLFFLSVTDKYIKEYKKQKFGFVKCGEEARFNIAEYDIAGKKGARVRADINHATKAGLTVHEYKVLQKKNTKLEREFNRITNEWLDGKSSTQLGFTLGGVGLDNPMDKRYFYAVDENGKMQGFIVFCPFASDKGYMADVTRRAKDAPSGIMEKIIYEAFQVFKAEGKIWASMGLAPLANITEEGKKPSATEKLLTYIYDNLNNIYNFKSLYLAKMRYSPTSWNNGYFVYMPRIMTPQMIYAVIRIQNPQGISDYIKAFFNGAKQQILGKCKKLVDSVNRENKKTDTAGK